MEIADIDKLTFWSLFDDVSNQQFTIVQLNVVASPDSLRTIFVQGYTSYFVHIFT